jgi:hypothetical protein
LYFLKTASYQQRGQMSSQSFESIFHLRCLQTPCGQIAPEEADQGLFCSSCRAFIPHLQNPMGSLKKREQATRLPYTPLGRTLFHR